MRAKSIRKFKKLKSKKKRGKKIGKLKSLLLNWVARELKSKTSSNQILGAHLTEKCQRGQWTQIAKDSIVIESLTFKSS